VKPGEKYKGWRCSTCFAGNKMERGRCRQCGRAKKGGESEEEFVQRPDVRRKRGTKPKSSRIVVQSKGGRITGFQISGPAADIFFKGMTAAVGKTDITGDTKVVVNPEKKDA
jgi:hypothetical protein